MSPTTSRNDAPETLRRGLKRHCHQVDRQTGYVLRLKSDNSESLDCNQKARHEFFDHLRWLPVGHAAGFCLILNSIALRLVEMHRTDHSRFRKRHDFIPDFSHAERRTRIVIGVTAP